MAYRWIKQRFVFLSRKQGALESLKEFWDNLAGLAAICEFGDQRDSIIRDIFIQNVSNQRWSLTFKNFPKT